MAHTPRWGLGDTPSHVPEIRVLGVGGAGGNVVNNMLAKGIHGVEFVAINTDAQALMANQAPTKIQLGRELTKGLGAGARPSVGAQAAEESHREIEAALDGTDMVFVTAGMGGGTGTGAAPVVAAIAKKMGILTVAVVTKPFDSEGKKRLKAAEQGIEHLREVVDTLIIIPNERLLDIAEDDTTLIEAFEMSDDAVAETVRMVTDLIYIHGLINLDFADVRTTMVDGGTALMGAATATGDSRAKKAAEKAIASPLLGGVSIEGARNVLVNITAGITLGIREATQATKVIQEAAGDDAEVIFGTVIDEDIGNQIRVTFIATGFDRTESGAPLQPGLRRSVTLDTGSHAPPQYKGEDNLRQLDVPAYERRPPLDVPSGESSSPVIEEPQPASELQIWIQPGDATAEDLAEVYAALSELHRALGGIGVVLRDGAEGEVMELKPEEI